MGKSKKLVDYLETGVDQGYLGLFFCRVHQLHQFGILEAKLLPQHDLANLFFYPVLPLVKRLFVSHSFFV